MSEPAYDDFDDEKTPIVPSETMERLMQQLSSEHEEEHVRSPGVPTLTSDRPTRPMRPSVISRSDT